MGFGMGIQVRQKLPDFGLDPDPVAGPAARLRFALRQLLADLSDPFLEAGVVLPQALDERKQTVNPLFQADDGLYRWHPIPFGPTGWHGKIDQPILMRP
jgi:hypothetical protein